jgi:hypothetical protein
MTRETWMWTLVAGLALIWGTVAVATGDGLLVPAVICGIAVGCVASGPTRQRVAGWMAHAFSGPAWRTLLIVAGAMMLIQLLPVEMALLMAGDILVYLEAAAAVGLITAHTRLKPLLAAGRNRIGRMLAVRRPRAMPRGVRAVRPARRPPPADDAEGRGLAFA